MTDLFDGDPYITIEEDGADFTFIGGQPVMDQGFENHVNIALLTEPNWWGNDLEIQASRRISSNYIAASRKPINRQMLLDTSKAAEGDVSGEEFELVLVDTVNRISQQVDTAILYTPTSRDTETLLLTRSGQNWISQRDKPAHEQV